MGMEISKIKIKEDDTIILYCDTPIRNQLVFDVVKSLKNNYPNNKVIALPKSNMKITISLIKRFLNFIKNLIRRSSKG